MQNVANTAQLQAWNGYEGTHWAEHQDRWNAINANFDLPLFDAAAVQDGDRVLDVGCGGGATTRLAAAAAGRGSALGIDLSAPVLELAQARTAEAGITNASYVQGDAQVHPLEADAFDVAISRFGIMFFADPVAAFGNIASALRPGGRIAFLAAAEPAGNEWLMALRSLGALLPTGDFGAPGGPGMFSLADRDTAVSVLTSAGFQHVRAEHVRAHGVWGRDAEEAADFLLCSGPGRHLLEDLGPGTRESVREVLTEQLRPYENSGALPLRSTGWLLTGTRGERTPSA
ncbi:class I SAM-dependent methyltransferase [Streptomyces sp. NPDC048057]|uniref:class I SAM-dependent methyltransferase n=1 Tax=Streptomyces sp. NPDC048057 TaxID=3155628 RepID=UPI0033E12229